MAPINPLFCSFDNVRSTKAGTGLTVKHHSGFTKLLRGQCVYPRPVYAARSRQRTLDVPEADGSLGLVGDGLDEFLGILKRWLSFMSKMSTHLAGSTEQHLPSSAKFGGHREKTLV